MKSWRPSTRRSRHPRRSRRIFRTLKRSARLFSDAWEWEQRLRVSSISPNRNQSRPKPIGQNFKSALSPNLSPRMKELFLFECFSPDFFKVNLVGLVLFSGRFFKATNLEIFGIQGCLKRNELCWWANSNHAKREALKNCLWTFNQQVSQLLLS